MTTKRRPDYNGGWVATERDVLSTRAGDLALPPIPDVECKGLCWEACSMVPMTPVEADRVSRDLGEPVTMLGDGRCNALTPDHRCRAYLNRPTVCRLYGGAEGLMCPHGCTTRNGKYLTYAESMGHIAESARRGGEPFVPGFPMSIGRRR